MKVILLKDVKSLGKKGEIVEVSEGYGRNFIIPTKAGVLADAKNLNTLKLQVQNAEKIAEEKLEEAEALKKKLEEVKLIFHMKAGKKQYDISVDKKKMELDVPMKNFGGYDIKVKLHKDVEATLHVSVQSE